MALLNEALFTRLSGFAGLTALVGLRIYPRRLPQRPTFPAVSYFTVANDRQARHGGVTGDATPLIQIDCWGASYASAKAVAEQVRLAMNGFTGTISGVAVGYAHPENETDLFDGEPDPGIYHTALDFSVVHTEAVA